MNLEIAGNTLRAWGMALATMLVLWLVLEFIKHIVLQRLRSWARRTVHTWDDLLAHLIERIVWWVLLLLAVYAGLQWLTLPESLRAWPGIMLRATLWIQAGLWGVVLIDEWVQTRIRKEMAEGDGGTATTFGAFGLLGRIILWSMVILLVLDSIPGVEVTSLITGLGIGGLAVGLALQSILGDLFASFTIALDKPFVIGDFIVVDDYSGTVEDIGLKSTRIRSLTGEQLIFSNTDLLGSRIRNYKRMARRRVAFSIGVTYETPVEKLERIPDIVRTVIETQEDVTFDRAHFKSMGDFSLNYEVVYFIENPDYTVYMDRQQAINLALFRRFGEEGIEFAYPTQVVYLNQSAG